LPSFTDPENSPHMIGEERNSQSMCTRQHERGEIALRRATVIHVYPPLQKPDNLFALKPDNSTC